MPDDTGESLAALGAFLTVGEAEGLATLSGVASICV